MHRKQQQLRLELMEEDSDSFQHTCNAIRSAYHSLSCLILPHPNMSLSLQTGLAAESDQLHTAIGRPPSYSLPGAANKAHLWDMAPYASSIPDLQNMYVMPQLPSTSEQSCHSHQSTEYSLSENGYGPLSSHPSPTHSHWLDSQADNRILQQQPLSIQLGPATKHQDKLPTTTLLCTTTATFQSQALPAFMSSQKQERSILTTNSHICTVVWSCF